MRRLEPEMLNDRDVSILRDLARVRLLTGRQLERLHFSHLATGNARSSARRRSLGRLLQLELVTSLPRRVGGERAGSAGLVYTLDARAHRERSLWQPLPATRSGPPSRRPWAIGWQFVNHTLDVAELFVQVREAERGGQLTLLRFDAEPASWFRTGQDTIKPDAYVVLEAGGWERHWWIEVDRATESLPTVLLKLRRYLETYSSGSRGPDGVLPRVLVTVPDADRGRQLRRVAGNLLGANRFVEVHLFDEALAVLPGQQARPPP